MRKACSLSGSGRTGTEAIGLRASPATLSQNGLDQVETRNEYWLPRWNLDRDYSVGTPVSQQRVSFRADASPVENKQGAAK